MSCYKYLITDKEDFDSIVEYIESGIEDIIGIDTETNAKFSKFELGLVGISLGFDLFAVYIPLMHDEGEQLDLGYVLGKLKPYLENRNSRYVFHNAKFDERVFSVYGIEAQGSGDDTFVLQWLLNENRGKGERGLKSLTRHYLRVRTETYEEVVDRRKKKRGEAKDYSFARVALGDALSYAADDAYYTRELYLLFSELARREGVLDAYRHIERPLLRVLRHMEDRGLLIDREYLEYCREYFPSLIEELEKKILEEAGEYFNVDSPQQLGEMLFDTLKIAKNVPTTRTGQYSTDAKTLEKYVKHQIVADVLKRRKMKKLHTTFIEGISKFVEKDGRLHANFNSTGAATGRFSSNEPNMQNIPATELESIKVRDLFMPTPGYIFIVSDYSQIELRIMAHISNDETAIRAFKEGKKFHDETAREMFNLSSTEPVTHLHKLAAKTLNFGIPYGRGAFSVAEALGLPRPWCRDHMCGECGQCYINKWFEAFPKVKECIDQTVKDARKRGYVRTISGRKRRLTHICSPDAKLRTGAERQAFNTRGQGSAADIIKLAMVALEPKLKKYDAHILIQVHDELVVEAPIENAEKVVEIMQTTMEHPLNEKNPLCLPLVAEPVIVDRWSKAK